MITYGRASELLDYNPDTGDLTWKVTICSRAVAGSVAGSAHFRTDRNGKPSSIYIQIDGKRYGAHRLAWLLYYREFPMIFIDHINNNPLDNRICNLREATTSQNGMNRGKPKNNTSGLKGVSWSLKSAKWRSKISCDGKLHLLGLFDTPEEAHKAYCKKAKELHGEFANTGQETYENLQQ